jgi:hypothetical protein
MNDITKTSNIDDALINRYREASTQLDEAPNQRVRASVLAHAASVAQSNARGQNSTNTTTFSNRRAANDGLWRYAAAAAVITASLTAFVTYQINKTPPSDHVAAASAPQSAPTSAPQSASVPAPSSAKPETTAGAAANASAAAAPPAPSPKQSEAPQVAIARDKAATADTRANVAKAESAEPNAKAKLPANEKDGFASLGRERVAAAATPVPTPVASPVPATSAAASVAGARDADAETSVAMLEQKRASTLNASPNAARQFEPPAPARTEALEKAARITESAVASAPSAPSAPAAPTMAAAPVARSAPSAASAPPPAAAAPQMGAMASDTVASAAGGARVSESASSVAKTSVPKIGEMTPDMRRGMQIVQANADLRGAVSAGNVAQARSAIRRGADINVTEPSGDSMLIVATRKGSNDIVLDLLSAGADVNRRDAAGMTAIDYARRSGNQALIDVLERAGAR